MEERKLKRSRTQKARALPNPEIRFPTLKRKKMMIGTQRKETPMTSKIEEVMF